MTVEDWLPMPPEQGPPLPRFLQIFWPWYKAPPEPPPGMANLYGAVTDNQTGQPVGGFAVDVTGAATFSAATDADGHYEILNMTPGTYVVAFSKAGYVTVTY